MNDRLPVGRSGPESANGKAGDIGSALGAIELWDARFAACAARSSGGTVTSHGDTSKVVGVASITKLVTAWAVLLASEEGAFSLADPLGPPGSTVAHLLCHAGGYGFDGPEVLAAPATRRIYSNTGYEVLADHVAATTGIAFAAYVAEGVLLPLAMTSTELRGSAAKDLHSNVDDLMRFLEELRRPSLIDGTTAAGTRQVHFPGLDGVLPGWGIQRPCDWGLGPELRSTKSPHWSGDSAEPGTFGHFGGAGTLMWLDPTSGIGCVALSDRAFGEWSVALWPDFSDGVRRACT